MASERSSRRARDEREGDRDQIAQTAAPSTRHPVDEVLPPGPMFVYGLQHVMSVYAGVVAVPLIVGGAMGLEFADLGQLPHEDTFITSHRPTDVDQGPLPPRTVSPSQPAAPPYEPEADKETPR